MVALRIRPAIVLFGDSITEQAFGVEGKVGWASLLASDYARRADVLNRGFSGYNTQMALPLLPKVFPPSKDNQEGSGILFCTVFFGANDACLPGERQHVPIEEYAKNLETIIGTIRSAATKDDDKFPIILMTPPPFDPAAWRKCRDLEEDGRANNVAKSYGEKVLELGKSLGCSVLNVWNLLEGATSPEVYGRYLSDGLHLNEEGNRKVHEGLMELIGKDHPSLAPLEAGATGEGLAVEEKLWRELC
eukprot:Sro261_g101890.1 Isoamyl acetate-hydrolyzing esterase 1 homolog (247) ;mRNA; r:77191-78046